MTDFLPTGSSSPHECILLAECAKQSCIIWFVPMFLSCCVCMKLVASKKYTYIYIYIHMSIQHAYIYIYTCRPVIPDLGSAATRLPQTLALLCRGLLVLPHVVETGFLSRTGDLLRCDLEVIELETSFFLRTARLTIG